MVCRTNRGAEDRDLFPPQSIVEIKALAYQLPSRLGLPFSRLRSTDIAREAVARGVVIAISVTTVWRYLHSDAIKPWMHHSWLFPRDTLFAEKAARVREWSSALGMFCRRAMPEENHIPGTNAR
jgi:hypothetical protein